MNKTELIDHIALQADISKVSAERALNAAIEGIVTALKKDEIVRLADFGSFHVSLHAARIGRNPRTGATIEIAAAKVLRFRAAKRLKEAIN
ncbi:MAG: HU family DNA-binding protein [Zoogloeaceae bacterium]|jgi:DNA-binding protein HU-beta|nr:HU family DNA-binding protein [Zoogloeaceae bacterium]